MQQVKFREGQIAISNDPDTRTAVIIEYNDLKSYAIYLDMPVAEAKQRFTQRMNERSDFEIEREGWEAKVSQISITDEIHICGDWSDQVAGLIKSLGIPGLGGN